MANECKYPSDAVKVNRDDVVTVADVSTHRQARTLSRLSTDDTEPRRRAAPIALHRFYAPSTTTTLVAENRLSSCLMSA